MDLKERLDKITDHMKVEDYENVEFPKTILVEVTNSCNLNCVFCANSKMTRDRGFINKEMLMSVLEEAFKEGVREVGFYTTGEPLLCKDLEDYISFSKKLGYQYIYITTNGVLANIERIKRLYNCGLNSIKFSINAIEKETYKLVHNVDAFDKVISNLKNIYEYKIANNLDLKIYVSYIATKNTNLDRGTILDFFKKISDDVFIVNVRNQSGFMPEINEFLNNDQENNNVASKRNIPCYYTFKNLIVTKEGYLSACCTDFNNYLTYANLKEESLKSAWNNSFIKNLRKKQVNNDLFGSLCYNCIYNSKTCPKPIREDLATILDENFFSKTDQKVINFKNKMEGKYGKR